MDYKREYARDYVVFEDELGVCERLQFMQESLENVCDLLERLVELNEKADLPQPASEPCNDKLERGMRIAKVGADIEEAKKQGFLEKQEKMISRIFGNDGSN